MIRILTVQIWIMSYIHHNQSRLLLCMASFNRVISFSPTLLKGIKTKLILFFLLRCTCWMLFFRTVLHSFGKPLFNVHHWYRNMANVPLYIFVFSIFCVQFYFVARHLLIRPSVGRSIFSNLWSVAPGYHSAMFHLFVMRPSSDAWRPKLERYLTTSDLATQVYLSFYQNQESNTFLLFSIATVHLPRIGYNTPSFNWYGTERLVRKLLVSKGIETFMYPYHSQASV